MAITLTTVKCPDCGASLPIEEGREKIFCSFCGAQIQITNENEHIYRHIDEAELKQAETDHLIKLKQLEMDEKEYASEELRKNIKFKISIILGALGLVCMFIGYLLDDGSAFLMVGMVSFIALMYMWLLGNNNDDKKKRRVPDGTVRIPSSIDDYSNKSFQAVESLFRGAGFTNIQCVPLGDLTTGFFKKPNMVDSITINGNDIDNYDSDEPFYPNAAVMISYHSFQ